MPVRIETQRDHKSGSTRFIARAIFEDRCICEVDEYGGPPDKVIAEIQERLCRRVARFVRTEWDEIVDQYWVERYVGSKQVWDPRPF